jgi:hypothetical protein
MTISSTLAEKFDHYHANNRAPAVDVQDHQIPIRTESDWRQQIGTCLSL